MSGFLLGMVLFSSNQLGWRAGTPSPILEDNPEYVELYWKSWENAQSAVVEETRLGSLPPRFLAQNGILKFDSSLVWANYLRWAHKAIPVQETIQFLLSKVMPNGQMFDYLDLSTIEQIGTARGIPLTGFSLWNFYLITGNKEFLRLNIGSAIKRHAMFEDAYKNVQKKRYLPVDFRPFISEVPNENLPDSSDATALLLLDAEFLLRSAKATGIKDGEKVLQNLQNQELIRFEKLWHNESEYYRAFEKENNLFEPISILPIWAVISEKLKPERVQKVLKKLSDSNFFSSRMPFALTPLSTQPKQTISPLGSYLSYKALLAGGKRSEAGYSVESVLDAYAKEAGESKTLFGQFDSETRKPTPFAERNALDCGLIAISGLIEAIIGIEVNASENLIRWQIWRTDRHGLERIRFGDNVVSLICEKRNSRTQPAKISISAEKSFQLHLQFGGYDKRIKVAAGNTVINTP